MQNQQNASRDEKREDFRKEVLAAIEPFIKFGAGAEKHHPSAVFAHRWNSAIEARHILALQALKEKLS
jgi:hypothetical protein